MKDKIRNRDGRDRFTATKPEIKEKIMEVEYTIPLNVAGKNLSAQIIIKRDGQEECQKRE